MSFAPAEEAHEIGSVGCQRVRGHSALRHQVMQEWPDRITIRVGPVDRLCHGTPASDALTTSTAGGEGRLEESSDFLPCRLDHDRLRRKTTSSTSGGRRSKTQ